MCGCGRCIHGQGEEMFKNYKYPLIKELRDQQVRYVPREKKLEQLDRAERFLAEIDKKQVYAYKFVCHRITEFFPELNANEMFEGENLYEDILHFIDDLADSVVIPIESVNELIWTIEQLSERFKVSTKTIARWRKAGLVSRRFWVEGKKRIGFLDSSVENFINIDPERVRRGEQFSQLSGEERHALIQRAREMSEQGGSPTEVAKQLSESTGRSIETIRYTLKAFDEANSENALFPNRNSPLGDDIRRKIYQGFRRDETVEELAKRYKRTKGSIYRIVGQFRARRILDLTLDYIDSTEFAEALAGRKEAKIVGPAPQSPSDSKKKNTAKDHIHNSNGKDYVKYDEDTVGSEVFQESDEDETESGGIPPYLAGLYDIPLLTPQQETHLFRKMNYLKYKANILREKLDIDKPKAYLMSQIEELYDQAVETKNDIVSANLRLVVSIAKKHIGPFAGFFELVSDGNLTLIKAVEKFDYSRGNKFSTYATWAIMRNFARTIPDEKKYRDRFFPNDTDVFDSTEDYRALNTVEEKIQSERERLLDHLLDELSERERRILVSRYGIGRNETPRTLRQIGVDMEVTKERVRQIEIRALAKLKKAMEEENLEIPGFDAPQRQ